MLFGGSPFYVRRVSRVAIVGASCGALCLALLLGGSFLRADEPAAKPCTAELLDKAKAKLAEADAKLAALDKDPRKPPPNKFTRDFESDKSEADKEVKADQDIVKEAQERLALKQKELADQEAKVGVQFSGQTGAQLTKAQAQNMEQKKAKQDRLDEALKAREKFAQDPAMVDQAKTVAAQRQELGDALSRSVDPDSAGDLLDKLSDPARRSEAQGAIDDTSYRLEFTALTPDGDVLGHAERLGDFKTFANKQINDLRQKLQAAAKDARDGKPGAYDNLRQLGTQFVAEIDRCRQPVVDAVAKLTKAQDALQKRMEDLDPNGASLVNEIPDLTRQIKELEDQDQKLMVQSELAGLAADVEKAKKSLATDEDDLKTSKANAAAAAKALADNLAYSAALDPWVKQKKAAQDEVAAAQRALEDETKAKAAALAKAQADYAANEASLREFRQSVLKEKGEIDKLSTTDPKTYNERLKALRDKVKNRKAEALKVVEGIKATLDPFRHCFKDVNDYVENPIKPKIVALGGTAETAAGISDMDDPLAALLDVPVDKTTEEAEVWIRSDPVIASGGKDGRKPPGLQGVGPTSLGFTTMRDGKTWTNTMTWSEPLPKLHKGDPVTLKIDSSSQEGWANIGGWWNINCAERGSMKGETSAGSAKGWRAGPNPHSATCTFKFAPDRDSVYIQISAGHDPNPNQWMLVTWTYEKKK